VRLTRYVFRLCFKLPKKLKWMFAENVFLSGAKDIQDQLSQEYKLFLQVNEEFADALETIHNNPSTLMVSSSDTFMKMKVMDKSLESIKKGLEHYMELKQTKFPKVFSSTQLE